MQWEWERLCFSLHHKKVIVVRKGIRCKAAAVQDVLGRVRTRAVHGARAAGPHRTLSVACIPGARLPASVGYEKRDIEKKRDDGGSTLTRRVRLEVL